MPLKILIAGAGALGCLYAGILSNRGHRLTLLGRKPIVEAARKGDLKIEGLLNLEVKVEKAVESPSQLQGETFDLILLTVKAYQAAETARQLTPLISKAKTPILCLQNGLRVETEVRRALKGLAPVVRGVSFLGALREALNRVRCTGFGATLVADRPLPALRDFIDTLKAFGLEAELKTNIEGVVWEKTLVNAGINPLGALTGLKNGQLLEVEPLRELMAETIREGLRVALAHGVKLPSDPVELAFKVAKATAENYNSMLQDLRSGKRTEIDYINGAIVRFGEEAWISTPLNRTLTRLVKGLEAKRVGGL
ncbi:MAG: ketopantoate reductase family protein [Candidatus Hecatellaceae archaeon]